MFGLIFFLGTVFFISATGAMAPGPVTAVTIAKGHSSSRAGVLIAFGHGAVEIPLIIAIALGLSVVFKQPWWKFFIGVTGGATLVWMGIGMIRDRKALGAGEKNVPYGGFRAGALTSVSNPYFFIWWATVGATLITRSLAWRIYGVILMTAVHWSVDLIWYWLLTFMTHHGKSIISPKLQSGVFAACGILLVSFGAYFFLDGSGALERLGALLT